MDRLDRERERERERETNLIMRKERENNLIFVTQLATVNCYY